MKDKNSYQDTSVEIESKFSLFTQKLKTSMKSFFKTFTNNKLIFETRKRSILLPLFILALIVSSLSLPTYFLAKSINGENLMKNFPQITNAMNTVLASDMDCKIENRILKCSEDTPALNVLVDGDIKYTVIVNEKSIAQDTEVSYTTVKNTDNLIILYSQTARIRYIQRDHVQGKVQSYEVIGDYSKLEGFSFKDSTARITANPESIKTEAENFIANIYTSTLNTQLIVNVSSSLISFLLLVFVTCVILKGTLRLTKGFKLIECFKMSLTSAAPGLIITAFLCMLFGFQMFATIFGFIFVGRILFIYFKHIFNGSIFKELYEETKNESYNLKWLF